MLAGASAGLTLFYSGRAHRLTFEASFRGNILSLSGLHEAPVYTRSILLFLGAISLVGGFIVSDALTSSSGALGIEDYSLSVLEPEVELQADRALLVLTPLLCSLIGAQLGSFSYPINHARLAQINSKANTWQLLKGSLDAGFNTYLIRPGLSLG